MAIAVIHHFPGATKENYEASVREVHPANGLPAGQIFHAAGASPDGWNVIVVYESKQAWEKFRDEVLMPSFRAGIKGGFSAPPQETVVELSTLLP